MRGLLLIILIGLTVGALVPTAEADGAPSAPTSPAPTSDGGAPVGPDPSTCRPYCFGD